MTSVHQLPPHAKKVFQGDFFSVWQWEQELYDGSHVTFERVARPDYAFVLGVLPDKKILLVEDEQPDRPAILAPAGGGVEAGETPARAAQREFTEETGYAAGRLLPWYTYRPAHKVEMRVHAFIGRELHEMHPPALEAGEKIVLRTLTFDEFLELGHEPRVPEWRLRVTLLEAKLDRAKRDALHALLYD